ncbi:S-type pyocin domain-containing protein [Pseudomonas sp. S1Bt30]|uniref:S-type pyocin domain-containing protein n=2 Tax=Pseudomonas TaxID=286 RepID=A0ABY6QMX9_9PSED|nr:MULTISPECIES: S-type pyocin domain-containing protein [Pseudomonas]MCX4066491.1 S-type pyocin domain-containing protein [Pseudomonas quebecensis]UZW21355.1 S-type pyocin domain-containing protein [Pseudomonas quebecensis]UZW26363.1 S-type pyocin domain-containing protein [Pseudomonas quebecensis]UZW31423.1 S-type pyocin domain-containing protein [Pseudomonas quebecensis]
MPETISKSIAAIEQNEGGPASEVDKIEQHIRSVDTLIAQKAQVSAAQKVIADKYYYGDFFRFPTMQFIKDAISGSKTNYPPDKNYKEWYASLEAAYAAKYSNREIDYLNALKQNLQAQANQARADAEAKRIADEAAAAEAARVAAEAAAAEAARVAAEAAALKAAHTFRLPGAGATQLTAAAGSIAVTAGSGVTLEAAIKAAKVALGTVVSAATAVGIGALTYSESLGNGELPATMLDLPAKELAPSLPDNLLEVAAAGGTVDVPYRLYGDQSKYSVVATQVTGGLAPTIPVRALVLDPVANAYTFTTTDTPPITLAFPIALPGNSSTATPAQPVETPVYTGITLTPIEVKAVPFPIASQLGIRDAIYVYPADSGLPPIYAVFSSPYEGATTKGIHSGRVYNPDKAGGPTQDLDWATATVTQEGIDLVKLHTSRFVPSDANKIMIDRLEKILSGHISITDVDKRFYTHEMRELERYRAIGVADGVEGNIWNNAHTATLEDYKLRDADDLFYTPEAIAAEIKQVYGE